MNQLIRALGLPEHPRILEIGCGTGGNLPILAGHGQVSAVEINETARNIALQRHGHLANIQSGWLPDNIAGIGAGFNLICLFDVLEHIENDKEALTSLKDLLAPNGRILISVPAYQWLWSHHDEYHHHYRRYSGSKLSTLVASAGLQVRRISCFNTLLFPAAVCIRLIERLQRKQSSSLALPSRPINNMLTAIFSLEARLLELVNLPFGLSLTAIISLPDAP